MGEFDGSGSVTIFINRISSMVNRYGRYEVLSVLPLCLKNNKSDEGLGGARDWYDTLDQRTLERMDCDVNEWVIQLRRRFQRDVMDAEEAADKCVFSFANEDKLSLRAYITRKIVLLREADYEDEGKMIQKIWRGLDPRLMNAVRITPFESLDAFIQKLYTQEFSARRDYQQMQNLFKSAKLPTYAIASRPLMDRRERPAAAPVATAPVATARPPFRFLERPKETAHGDTSNKENALPDVIRGRARYPCTICGSNDHLDNWHRENEKKPTGFKPRALRAMFANKKEGYDHDLMDVDLAEEEIRDEAKDMDDEIRSIIAESTTENY